MDIQRYAVGGNYGEGYCDKITDGEWVLYEDHAQRLAAAEQRNAELVELLREVAETLWQEDDSGDLFERIDAALKPTESGASE